MSAVTLMYSFVMSSSPPDFPFFSLPIASIISAGVISAFRSKSEESLMGVGIVTSLGSGCVSPE